MLHKRRQWDQLFDEDPASGLLNLFDVWIAFAATLLIATVTYYSSAQPLSGKQQVDRGVKMEHYRSTQDKLTGNGERLGTAYRLSNGDVVYVPDASATGR